MYRRIISRLDLPPHRFDVAASKSHPLRTKILDRSGRSSDKSGYNYISLASKNLKKQGTI